MRRLLLPLLMLVGCEIPPRFVEESAEIDAFLARRAYRSACVGLEAREASLREYTARQLAGFGHVTVANQCVCAAEYDAEAGTWDPAVVAGLAGNHRDDFASCLAPALSDSRITGESRADLVRALGAIDAQSAYGAIEALVKDDPDPAVRAQACGGVRPSEAAVPTLIAAVKSDTDAGVRAACAAALEGRKDEPSLTVLLAAAREDPDGGVRGAALEALLSRKSQDVDDLLCKAMIEDPDERTRLAAVKAWHGTKRKKGLDCLEARAKKPEESGAVRVALLAALGASPNDEAALILCRNIGPWVRMYVKDKVAYDIEGADIVRAQNDRDWERSYDCVNKALQQSGYSCFGRNYLGHWMKDLGGKASTPQCPGMPRN